MLQLIQVTIGAVPSSRVGFGGLIPSNKARSPRNWNLKQILKCQAPCTNVLKTFWRRFWIAVVDISHNFMKQSCIYLCNYHEIVWTINKRTSQNSSVSNVSTVDCCVSHKFVLGKVGRGLRFSRICRAYVQCIIWQENACWFLLNTRASVRCDSGSYKRFVIVLLCGIWWTTRSTQTCCIVVSTIPGVGDLVRVAGAAVGQGVGGQ